MAGPTSRVSRVLMTGPLVPFEDAYREELRRRGYTVRSAVCEVRQVARFSRWLDVNGLDVSEANDARVDEFMAWQRGEGRYRSHRSRPGLRCLLDVLRERGVVAVEEPAAPCSPTDVLLGRFERYLAAERGLAAGTVALYSARARRFVEGLAADGSLSGLAAGDVTAAVARESESVSVSATQNFVNGVRALLRFCFIVGVIESDLSQAALLVRGRSTSMLPWGISSADAQALLRSCDRRQALGRRDYAIIIMLLRLGLRRSELAGLRFDDIDWRAGELVVRGKGSRVDRLPLPADVGEAIASYLRRGRPHSSRRECSCDPKHRMSRSLPERWPRLCVGPAGAPASRRSDHTGCGTPRRARWSRRTSRLCGSGRCCDTAACKAPRATRVSTSSGCDCWRRRGRQEVHSDERPASARR